METEERIDVHPRTCQRACWVLLLHYGPNKQAVASQQVEQQGFVLEKGASHSTVHLTGNVLQCVA